MLIHEVCKHCSLTKKAVEYYERQGLLSPDVMENGYRQFSPSDVEKLRKISLLRGLGLSVAEIKAVLTFGEGAALPRILHKKAGELEELRAKEALLRQLAVHQNWEEVREQLDLLQRKRSILERLLDAFPGSYGRFVSAHFAAYLNEPLTTPEQQEAYGEVLRFLDRVKLEIPSDLEEFLEETWDNTLLDKVQENLTQAAEHPEQFLRDHQEILRQYQAVLASEEYRATPAFRLRELLGEFHASSGYNEVFLPAMKRLSPSYRRYHAALEAADEVFREQLEHP